MKNNINGMAFTGSKIILLLLGCAFLCQSTSCKKYLDVKSDKKLVVPHTLSDLQGLLDDNFYMNTMGTPSFGEASADDYFLTTDVYNSLWDAAQQCYIWQLEDYNYGSAGDWATAYKVIYNANSCLDQISTITKTNQNETEWDNVKGSALFFRAYYFLDLAWDYAKAYDENTAKTDPGIVLRLSSDFNIPSKRASVQNTYQQIINDAMIAAQYLPDNPANVMRPSKAAAYGLLARAYLSMRMYDSAYKYADLSLQIKNDLLNYNSSQVDSTSLTPFPPFNNEIIFYTVESSNYGSASPSFASIDTTLYASYDSNDLRKSDFFYLNNGYQTFKGTYSGNQYAFFSGIATDEMYLTRAECEARLGKVTEALNDLNTLLINRWETGTFVPITTSNQQQLLKIILNGRRKELLMRGLRWIDIKRLNKEGNNIILRRVIGSQTYTLLPNANRYALPLPADVIKLTGMQQNPQ